MRFLLVDLEGVFWARAMSGMPPYDVASEAVKSLRGLAKDFDRVICATGGREENRPPCTGASFRTAFWPSYKADRKDRPEAMWMALAQLIEACRAEGWLVVEAPERETPESDGRVVFYEADDVLATAAAFLAGRDHDVVIRSDDTDLAQCVGPRVRQLRRLKSGDLVLLDAGGVETWLGVPPSQVAEMKAIAGDKDGYKPIPGVAEGHAKKMLATVQGHTAREVRAYCESLVDDKRNNTHRLLLELYTPDVIDRAYIAAKTCSDVPIDLSSLEAEPVRVGRRDIAAGMVPDAEFESDGAPIQPDAGMVVHDASARMLASPAEAYGRMVEFQAFVKKCMVPGVDFEKYTWTPKPILLKPGAEKLGEIYGYAATFEIEKAEERWDGDPLFYYRVRCRLVRKSDRMLIAECVGSCNSRESKYRDRWAYESDIPEGLDPSKLERKEHTAKDGRRKYFKYKVPNPDIYDQVNTVLKMAEKRAFVGAVIIATRSGGVFGQDLDTMKVPDAAYGEASEARQWET